MGAPRIISLHTILGPPDHFLRLLYGAPQISFFSYNMGAPLRSVSLFTIWDHLTFRFFSQNIWGLPQISFSAYYMGSPQISFCAYFLGAPLRSVFSLTIWGPSQISFFSYYMGPPQISFFEYYMGGPSDQFLRLLYGGPLMLHRGSLDLYFRTFHMVWYGKILFDK